LRKECLVLLFLEAKNVSSDATQKETYSGKQQSRDSSGIFFTKTTTKLLDLKE
jgi:hypothetical protein